METSKQLYRRACQIIPGGVNSPVRAFKAVGGIPPFISRAEGAWLFDADGKRYIDYVGSWGPMILGHAHPEVLNFVEHYAKRGLGYGAPTEIEIKIAEQITALMPSIEMLRLVNSGSEAVMSAVRLARGYTGRNQIIKFDGCYHGHSDSMLVGAGSGSLTLGIPNSPGVPQACVSLTTVLDYNDTEQVRSIFGKLGTEIAAVIVEPVAGNMNFVPANKDFLQTLRQCCDRYGALLIFDEVMSGFRVALGGAQSIYQIKPDLTILGKIIGGGLPVGAFGGRRDVMEQLAPVGPVYQAGTLSGNPVAVAAGYKTLELLCTDQLFDNIAQTTKTLVEGLTDCATEASLEFYSDSLGAMFGFFFGSNNAVRSFKQVRDCNNAQNQKIFKNFFHCMLESGVYLAPSPFEAGFVSAAHGEADIEHTLTVARQAMRNLKVA